MTRYWKELKEIKSEIACLRTAIRKLKENK